MCVDKLINPFFTLICTVYFMHFNMKPKKWSHKRTQCNL